MTSKNEKFSIDDAFESDTDEVTKLYGSTNRSDPLHLNLRNNNKGTSAESLSSDNVYVSMQMPKKDSAPLGGRLLKIPEDALSKDSDSLINDGSYCEKFDPESNWWNHPKVRRNWKIVVAAFLLLFLGIGLIAAGITMYLFPDIGIPGFVFFITGAICLIPGVYHVVFIYFASKGKKGFHFHNLPIFN